MTLTQTNGLIVPEVWADAIQAKFPGRLVLAQYGFMDNTLDGQPGDTVNFTEWDKIDDAADVNEDDSLVPEKMTQSDDSVAIKEAGKAVEITDKSILTAVGNPITEAQRQVTLSVSRKIDKDIRDAIHTAIGDTHDNYVDTTDGISTSVIVDGIERFGDDFEPQNYVLVIHSSQRADLYNDDQFIDASKYGSDQVIVTGEIGRLYGMPVVVSDRGASKEEDDSFKSLIVRLGSTPSQDRGEYGPAYGTVYKRQPIVETDRDILARTNLITTNVHYAVKVLDESGLVVLHTNATE